VVLLTGMRLTAHVYDEFAPKLTACCHVYAITRRGYGASSRPSTGYDDQRLADDVLEVLNQLKLVRPLLIGHSLAGGELATLGRQHSDRLGGLVFVEALDDPEDELGSDPEWTRLLQQLPEGFLESAGQAPSGPRPDYSSFPAYRAWQAQNRHYALPESELRQLFVANPDGTVGAYKVRPTTLTTPSEKARRSETTRGFECQSWPSAGSVRSQLKINREQWAISRRMRRTVPESRPSIVLPGCT
jgi:non-heme chloroperoxidase